MPNNRGQITLTAAVTDPDHFDRWINHGRGTARQSTFAPDSFTTWAHLISSATSGGEIKTGPAEFSALLKTELIKWAQVVKESGAKVD